MIPRIQETHWVYLLSLNGKISAAIDTGDAITTHVLPEGKVVAIDGGSNNTGSNVITSDMPRVAHLGRDSADSPLNASPGRYQVPGCGGYRAVKWPMSAPRMDLPFGAASCGRLPDSI